MRVCEWDASGSGTGCRASGGEAGRASPTSARAAPLLASRADPPRLPPTSRPHGHVYVALRARSRKSPTLASQSISCHPWTTRGHSRRARMCRSDLHTRRSRSSPRHRPRSSRRRALGTRSRRRSPCLLSTPVTMLRGDTTSVQLRPCGRHGVRSAWPHRRECEGCRRR